jgi:hypothetical protein
MISKGMSKHLFRDEVQGANPAVNQRYDKDLQRCQKPLKKHPPFGLC